MEHVTRTRVVASIAMLVVALGILIPASPAAATLPGTSNGGVRIMALGDSITHGGSTGGYRDLVAATLATSGYTVDFVGTMEGGPVGAQRDNEGHPGWTIGMIDAEVGHWLFASDPRTVLLQAGTNDILAGRTAAQAANDLATLVAHILAYKPGIELFVAQLPPIFNDKYTVVQQFNALVPGIVSAAGSHVHLVNLFGDLVYPDDYFPSDVVHPDESGYVKMAPKWSAALVAVPASLTPLPPAATAPINATISLRGSNGLYVTAWQPAGHGLFAVVSHVAAWEKFVVVDAGNGFVALYSVGSSRFVTTAPATGSPLVATSTQLTPAEMFRWVEVAAGKTVLVSAATSEFVIVTDGVVRGDSKLAYAESVFDWQLAP